jgi:hypothetical protein
MPRHFQGVYKGGYIREIYKRSPPLHMGLPIGARFGSGRSLVRGVSAMATSPAGTWQQCRESSGIAADGVRRSFTIKERSCPYGIVINNAERVEQYEKNLFGIPFGCL